MRKRPDAEEVFTRVVAAFGMKGNIEMSERRVVFEYDDPLYKGVKHQIIGREGVITYSEKYDETKKASVIRFTLTSKDE